MPASFEPRTDILPKAQQEIWPLLAPTADLSFVLYGGTAVALYFGHRVSVDFDFFSSAPLDKRRLEASLPFLRQAETLQEVWLKRVSEGAACGLVKMHAPCAAHLIVSYPTLAPRSN